MHPRIQRLAAFVARAGKGVRAAVAAVGSPAAIVCILVLAGCVMAGAGAFILAGIGWALVAGSALAFLLAALLARGLMRG